MHAHTCTQACTCTHTSTHTCTQACTHTCTQARTHTCTQARTHTCTQARTHHARKHVHTMHAHVHTMHASTHTHAHTHTQISEQFLMYHNLTICLLVLLETQISLETFGVLRKNGAFSWDVVGPSSDIQEIVGTGFKHFIKGVSP